MKSAIVVLGLVCLFLLGYARTVQMQLSEVHEELESLTDQMMATRRMVNDLHNELVIGPIHIRDSTFQGRIEPAAHPNTSILFPSK